MFRLHIDIPLDMGEEEAALLSEVIINEVKIAIAGEKESQLHFGIKTEHTDNKWNRVQKLQYRLANDDDRNLKNYLIKDENNHVANRKSVMEL